MQRHSLNGARAGDVRTKAEQLLARIISYSRVSTLAFVYLPLGAWNRLNHPLVALEIALAASAEAVWFYLRARRTGTVQDRVLVWVDVAFCVALLAIGSRTAFPGQGAVVTTELLPFTLVGAACVGFGLPSGIAAMMAILSLMTTWISSVIPGNTIKLIAGLLGFALSYLVALLAGRELRTLSRQVVLDREAAVESARQCAEHQAEVVRHQMHDVLLPLIEQIASGAEFSSDFVGRLRREAGRTRQFLDPRASPESGLRALLLEVCEVFTDAGLQIEIVIEINGEPPAEVAFAIATAAREALNNVRKHSGLSCPVLVRANGGRDRVEVVVRDRGKGFDPRTVAAGGGFGGTFRAVRRYDCACVVKSSPGAGTRVTIRWPARDAPLWPRREPRASPSRSLMITRYRWRGWRPGWLPSASTW
jgi:signal transduction histidine kinase